MLNNRLNKRRLSPARTLAISFCIFAALRRIEAQSAPPPAAIATTFRVAGTVVSSADGHPLSRASVTLRDAKNPQKAMSTITSEDGHFEFHGVPRGKYPLEGAKRGFITQSYNQREAYSTAIVTGADVSTENLILRLPPAAVLLIKVFDESGEPVRKAQVMLYREDRSSGVRRVAAANGGSTDDLGACEFTRINPGTYFVGVTATPWYAIHPTTLAGDQENGQSPVSDMRAFDVAYSPTYYGDTSDPDSAVPIAVKPGDKTQIEIHVAPVAALHLLINSPDNGMQGNRMPSLEIIGFEGSGRQMQMDFRNISPGQVKIVGVPPGRYKVNLPGQAGGEVDLVNNGQDLSAATGVALSTVHVSVAIFGEDKLPQPFFLQLRSDDGRTPPVGGRIDEKGEASLTDIKPGRYNMIAGTPTKIYSVVKVSTKDGVSSGPFLNIPAGSSLNVSLALVGGVVNVEGFAKRDGKGADGAMIVLVPKDPEANRELFRRDESDLDGSFSLQGIAPGTYTVVAIQDGWEMDWALPAVIEPYLKNGQTVTISDQGGHSMQLPAAVEVQERR